MPSALRSPSCPMGLPGLSGKDLEHLTVSNKLGWVSQRIQRLCYKLNVPGAEENPWQSFLWLRPDRRSFAKLPQVCDKVVDYCACGRPFRARTRIRFWKCAPHPGLDKLVCTGRGICSFSGKPHLELTGFSNNQFSTLMKNAYPPALCALLADSLHRACIAQQSTERWKHMRGYPQYNA